MNEVFVTHGEPRIDMLVSNKELPIFEKYDRYIPSELLRSAYFCDKMNVLEAQDRIEELIW